MKRTLLSLVSLCFLLALPALRAAPPGVDAAKAAAGKAPAGKMTPPKKALTVEQQQLYRAYVDVAKRYVYAPADHDGPILRADFVAKYGEKYAAMMRPKDLSATVEYTPPSLRIAVLQAPLISQKVENRVQRTTLQMLGGPVVIRSRRPLRSIPGEDTFIVMGRVAQEMVFSTNATTSVVSCRPQNITESFAVDGREVIAQVFDEVTITPSDLPRLIAAGYFPELRNLLDKLKGASSPTATASTAATAGKKPDPRTAGRQASSSGRTGTGTSARSSNLGGKPTGGGFSSSRLGSKISGPSGKTSGSGSGLKSTRNSSRFGGGTKR